MEKTEEDLVVQDGPEAKVVVWASRHAPLTSQLAELRKRLGPIRVVQIPSIPNAEWLAQRARQLNASLIVPVLPMSMIARLVELSKDIPVAWAEMEQVKTMTSEPRPNIDYDPINETVVVAAGAHEQRSYRIMRFKQFHRIKAIRMELEPL